jgi:DEAD/DEAH box helicase domain-containing protein
MGSLPYGSTERLDGVNSLANALEAIATLLVMCDARDLGRAVGENEESRRQKAEGRKQNEERRIQDSGFGSQKPEEDSGFRIQDSGAGDQSSQESKMGGFGLQVPVVVFEPNIYLYDKYPGGVGLSEPLFRLCDSLLEKTLRLISNCPCPNGCPSCVGPMGEVGEKGKEVALEILRRLSVVSGP